jgi:predicted MFS family arabinose efflux permease
MIAWSFGLVAAMGVLASIFVWTAMRDAGGNPRPAPGDVRHPLRAGSARVSALAAMAVTFGIGSFEVSILLWAVQVLRLEPSVVTRMLLECTLIMMAVQAGIFLLPGALPRLGPANASIAFATMALALAMAPLHPAAWLSFIAVAVLAISATLLQAMLAVHVVSANGRRTGEVLGIQLALSNGGQALGSLAAGTLFSASGRSFFAASAVLAIVAIWSARSASRPRTP